MRTLVLCGLAIFASTAVTMGNEPAKKEWTIADQKREGMIYVPESAKEIPAPVVFVFHGHGGSMANAARQFNIHGLWPEAIVVYLQGLNTPGRLTDPLGRRPGWQHAAGDSQDRDLKLFDSVLAELKRDQRVDENRIYSTGHSNGGGFTYLLWAERGNIFAAVAPSGAVATRFVSKLRPIPVMHIAGEKDELVKFNWQELGIQALLKHQQCVKPSTNDGLVRVHPSEIGCPVVTYIYPGGHKFPADAVPHIIKFFKENAKKAK